MYHSNTFDVQKPCKLGVPMYPSAMNCEVAGLTLSVILFSTCVPAQKVAL